MHAGKDFEISRRGYSAVRPAEVLRQRGCPLTAGRKIFEIINTHTSSLSLRACACFLVFVFPPSSPLSVPAAFTLVQLSVLVAAAVAILVGIRGRLRLRLGRVYDQVAHFCNTSAILNGRDLESHRRRFAESVPRLRQSQMMT